MVEIFGCIKKHRIRIIKVLITIVDIYFLFSCLMQLFNQKIRDYFQTLTLIYAMIILICNLLSEFSPYILQNYLKYIFPFLLDYNGRGIVYLFIGILSLMPEVSNTMRFAGYLLIFIGIVCIWINSILSKNFQIEYQDFVVMKENYQDYNDYSARESLNFPQNQGNVKK
ncbi:MAG: hypothetical protein MJ252_21895 [archaeon]|nr:hypothetical protein [archaeon]